MTNVCRPTSETRAVLRKSKFSSAANIFIAVVSVCGIAVIGYGASHFVVLDLSLSLVLLVIAVVAARFKVALPGLNGNMSVNLPFVLIAVGALSLGEALLISCASCAAQCLWKKGKNPLQMLFNVCNMANAVGIAYYVFACQPAGTGAGNRSLFFALSGIAFFLAHIPPLAMVISLTGGKDLWRVGSELVHLSFPHYAASTGLVFLVLTMKQYTGWRAPLMLVPVMYLMFRCYRVYFAPAAV